MQVYSTRLGEIEVEETDVIYFSRGLPGFIDEKNFIMFAYEDGSPFYLLQSTQTPELTFALVDPLEFFKDYEIKLDDETVAELELNEQNYPKVYAIITVPARVEEMTANLIAPLVINWEKKIAMQVILEKSPYKTRHRIYPEELVLKNSRKENK
ncbi:MAG: flagellar assembly protein FliW [Sporomusaceae bacterium]|jgi:flagellar assembly factor FliW|nr:flagellar assembly protein FliW [Sporomusaceae bacterium]